MAELAVKEDPKPSDGFHIAFDTLSMPGKIIVTTVILREEIIDTQHIDDRRFRLDLADHPLYRRLCGYVRGNPR